MRRWPVALLVLAAFAAGCSSSKSHAVPPAPSVTTVVTGNTKTGAVTGIVDPCTLLSDSDVAAATGSTSSGREQYPQTREVKEGTPVQAGCTWGELGGERG